MEILKKNMIFVKKLQKMKFLKKKHDICEKNYKK